MSLLKDVSSSVQQVAEAIGIAVGLEVEIVDNQLTIVGGTGRYIESIGEKEEAGKLDGNYLYARVLRTGKTEYIVDARNAENYSMQGEYGLIEELAEVCTPIKLGTNIIGIIGLVAVNEEQRSILLDKKRNMVSFVEKMADLLAAKAALQAELISSEISTNELSTILETTHEGIFALNKNGYIRHCNGIAEKLFKACKTDMIGTHINRFMRGTPALEIVRTGVGYTENEELYKLHEETLHLIVTAKPYYEDGQIGGIVLCFRDIVEAKRLVYNINNKALKYTFNDIIGDSQEILAIKNQAMVTSRGGSTILINGESGTGKEMFAKAIHYSSPRAGKPFVTINCGAIPESLLESELFGYEKGAFTGANEKGKIGKFEAADGGTIFLDEIGDMPLHLQVKLLHVLQNFRFERVGGNRTITVDVRVITATNKDLEDMIKQGTFREDLYYRISVIPLRTPTLRERGQDIKILMYYFLNKYNDFMNRKIEGFSEDVEKIYMNYDWPGNVRELENAVEYSVNMAFGKIIEVNEIPIRLIKGEESALKFEDSNLSLAEQVRIYEKEIIERKIKKYGDSPTAKELAATELGVSRATLYRKLVEPEIN